MPSARNVIMTKIDEAAFSAALKEKFPSLLIADGWTWKKPPLPVRESIDECEDRFVKILVPGRGWKPKLIKYGPYFDRVMIGNLPPLSLSFNRCDFDFMTRVWEVDGKPPNIYHGTVNVVCPSPPSREQKSFIGKVWRVIGKVCTNRLKYVNLTTGKVIVEIWKGGTDWVGHDAIRWAQEDETRVFDYIRSEEGKRGIVERGLRPLEPMES